MPIPLYDSIQKAGGGAWIDTSLIRDNTITEDQLSFAIPSGGGGGGTWDPGSATTAQLIALQATPDVVSIDPRTNTLLSESATRGRLAIVANTAITELTLPDATGMDDGYYCHIYLVHDTHDVSLRTGHTGQLYTGSANDRDHNNAVDTVFLGASRSQLAGTLYSLWIVQEKFVLDGPVRISGVSDRTIQGIYDDYRRASDNRDRRLIAEHYIDIEAGNQWETTTAHIPVSGDIEVEIRETIDVLGVHGSQLYTLNPSSGVLRVVANYSRTFDLVAVHRDHLWAVGDSSLYELDFSGDYWLIGDLGNNADSELTGLAWFQDHLYLLQVGKLYRIDPVTAQKTLVLDSYDPINSVSELTSGLTVHLDGHMYALGVSDSGVNGLYRIDPDEGTYLRIGATGLTGSTYFSMAPFNADLYIYDNAKLYLVDTTSGTATEDSTLTSPITVKGLSLRMYYFTLRLDVKELRRLPPSAAKGLVTINNALFVGTIFRIGRTAQNILLVTSVSNALDLVPVRVWRVGFLTGDEIVDLLSALPDDEKLPGTAVRGLVAYLESLQDDERLDATALKNLPAAGLSQRRLLDRQRIDIVNASEFVVTDIFVPDGTIEIVISERPELYAWQGTELLRVDDTTAATTFRGRYEEPGFPGDLFESIGYHHDTMYGVWASVTSRHLARIDLGSNDTYRTLGDMGSIGEVKSLISHDGDLLAFSMGGNIYWVNPSNGHTSLLARIPDIVSIAVTADGIFGFGDEGAGTAALYSINPIGWVVSLIGDTGISGSVSESTGAGPDLFMIIGSVLYSVNTTDATTATIGTAAILGSASGFTSIEEPAASLRAEDHALHALPEVAAGDAVTTHNALMLGIYSIGVTADGKLAVASGDVAKDLDPLSVYFYGILSGVEIVQSIERLRGDARLDAGSLRNLPTGSVESIQKKKLYSDNTLAFATSSAWSSTTFEWPDSGLMELRWNNQTDDSYATGAWIEASELHAISQNSAISIMMTGFFGVNIGQSAYGFGGAVATTDKPRGGLPILLRLNTLGRLQIATGVPNVLDPRPFEVWGVTFHAHIGEFYTLFSGSQALSHVEDATADVTLTEPWSLGRMIVFRARHTVGTPNSGDVRRHQEFHLVVPEFIDQFSESWYFDVRKYNHSIPTANYAVMQVILNPADRTKIRIVEYDTDGSGDAGIILSKIYMR